MSKKVFSLPPVPEGADYHSWIQFISAHCSQCEKPKNGCTDMTADLHQAKKCFNEWKKLPEGGSSCHHWRRAMAGLMDSPDFARGSRPKTNKEGE